MEGGGGQPATLQLLKDKLLVRFDSGDAASNAIAEVQKAASVAAAEAGFAAANAKAAKAFRAAIQAHRVAGWAGQATAQLEAAKDMHDAAIRTQERAADLRKRALQVAVNAQLSARSRTGE